MASGTLTAITTDGEAAVAAEQEWLQSVSDSIRNDAIPQQRFFKVPHSLRTNINAAAYEPILFKFGLWHGPPSSVNDYSASSATLFKLQAAKVFCDLGQKSPNRFDRLVMHLMQFDKQWKDSYGLKPNENKVMNRAVATAMALDVVTVYIAAKNDVQFHPPCVRSVVRSDAILLDNQLPIFAFRCLLHILKEDGVGNDVKVEPLVWLYSCRNSPFEFLADGECWSCGSREPHCDHESLLGCIYDGWVSEIKGPESAVTNDSRSRDSVTVLQMARLEPVPGSEIAHCTSFPSGMEEKSKFEERQRLLQQHDGASNSNDGSPNNNHSKLPLNGSHRSSCLLSAAHLYRRGIRFNAQERSLNSSTWKLGSCITFDDKRGIVTLPKITVVHGTRRLLLNLLAYEHTSRFSDACTLLSFVCFMDMLINSGEDVELLVDSGVVVNELGSHKHLATMWNGLTDGYPFRLSSVHQDLVRRIRIQSQRRWRRWNHTFRDSYYERRPWLFLSAALAVILLILTFLQTTYTIKGVLLEMHHKLHD